MRISASKREGWMLMLFLSLKGMNRNERTNIYFGILNLFTFSLMISETELNSNVSKWRKGKRFSGLDTTFWGLKILWHDNGMECAGKLSIWENFSHWIDYEFVLFRWRRNWVDWGCLGCYSVCLCTNNFQKGRHYQQTNISCYIRAENCWRLLFRVCI